jgi:hypothetical protein
LFLGICFVWALVDAMSQPMTKKKRHPGEPGDPIYKEGLITLSLNPKRPKPPDVEEPEE